MKYFLWLLVLCSAFAHPDDPSWIAPHQPYAITDNIYAVGTDGIGVYLITTPEGHILLDAAPEQGAAIVKQNIETLGFKLSDIKYLLETHAHFDHVGGMAKIKADTHAKLLASAGDKPALEEGRHLGDTNYGPAYFPAVKVDGLIKQGTKVTLGGVSLIVQLTPGHTKGCTSWMMQSPVKGINRSVIFLGSLTVAGNKLVGNKAYPNIVADFHRTFAQLKLLKADILLTGHPDFANLEEKYQAQLKGQSDVFINPSEFPQLVETSEVEFEQELAKQKNAGSSK